MHVELPGNVEGRTATSISEVASDGQCILLYYFSPNRLALQHLKLDSRMIAIIGLSMSIISCALIADWQSVPYDKCTEFSLYHNRALQMSHDQTSSLKIARNLESNSAYYTEIATTCKNAEYEYATCKWGCYIAVRLPDDSFEFHKYHCEEIHNTQYVCTWNESISLCVYIANNTVHHPHQINPALSLDKIQRFPMDEEYTDLQSECTQSVLYGDHCHWNPDSLITKHFCSECQPICRSLSHSLNFVQFCIGAAILMVSIPLAWVPVASIVSERTRSEMQASTM